MSAPKIVDISYLIESYEALFFDSFGVLIDGVDALPGAIDLVDRMNRDGTNYYVVTNDSSVSMESRVKSFASKGFDIPAERIVNSGSLIADYVVEAGLSGSPALVLGTDDARAYTAAGGVDLVEIGGDTEPDVVVVGHSGPHDWESTLETLLELFSRRFREGAPVKLVLPNPDFIYPNGPGNYGFGAAAFVNLLEQALERLHGDHESLKATRLGKPFAPIFESAIKHAGTRNAVMIGDQLETDILGANRVGIPSAVVTTGINRRSAPNEFSDVDQTLTPQYILHSLV